MSISPGVGVDVVPLAMNAPPKVNIWALTKFEAPLFGVKRYPSLDAFQTVLFLPGAAKARSLVKS